MLRKYVLLSISKTVKLLNILVKKHYTFFQNDLINIKNSIYLKYKLLALKDFTVGLE